MAELGFEGGRVFRVGVGRWGVVVKALSIKSLYEGTGARNHLLHLGLEM